MKRLTEKLADGRSVLKENYAYVTNPKHGSFIEGKAVDKLAEYEQAEEDGLLIRLPCKVGDEVYQIHTLPKSNRKVLAVVKADAFFITLCILEKRFGKTVFLNKAEAEQALAKMKGE